MSRKGLQMMQDKNLFINKPMKTEMSRSDNRNELLTFTPAGFFGL